MAYKKYFLYKKQYSVDGGITWLDVEPIELTPSGQSIGTYDTYADCEEDIPSAYNRFTYQRANGETGVSECSNSTTFTRYPDTHDIDENYDTIKRLVIGECIDTIGTESVGMFKVIESVDMSNSSVTTIEYKSFKPWWTTYDSTLTSVTFSTMLQSIGSEAFENCTLLRTLNFPSSLSTIDNNAFKGCTGLYDITSLSGTSVTRLGLGAFQDCTTLTKVALPTSLRELGGYSFEGTAIRSLDLKNVTTLGTGVFANCSNLSAMTINEGTVAVPTQGFLACGSLQSVSLPSTITTIGEMAFNSCTSLTGITFSEGLLTVGNSAFANTPSMTRTVILPSTVITLGSKIFHSSVSDVVVLATIPPTIASDTFSSAWSPYNPTYPIYVPDAAYEDYSLATNWKALADNGRLKPLSQKP